MPTTALLATTTLTTLAVTVYVSFIKMSYIPTSRWKVVFPLTLFAVCWVVLLVMFRLTKTVKLSIENTLLFSGKRGPSLIVRGNKRGGKSNVPLYMIEEIAEVTFDGPWWRSKVTGGLQEPGLQVTYRTQTLAGGGKKLLFKQQFPTQDAVLLKSVLESQPQ